MCDLCKKDKTPIESVNDKRIMSIDGLQGFNSPRLIYNPEYTTLPIFTITLDDKFQNYFKDIFFEDVIREKTLSKN